MSRVLYFDCFSGISGDMREILAGIERGDQRARLAGAGLVAVDTDGTPLHHGERMVEVQPGVWADPVMAQVEAFLAARIGTVHTD